MTHIALTIHISLWAVLPVGFRDAQAYWGLVEYEGR